jgi:hypothetical protein
MNNLKTHIFLLGLAFCLLFVSCGKKDSADPTTYTATDSLTEIYLTLQDSLLITWNTMINDDNQKIKTMKHLLHELEITSDITPDEAHSLTKRIDQLHQIRYTPKTMWNNDVISEYDFASESLVNELLTKAESINSFSYNTTLQALVDNIRAADLRVENYRMEYDALAVRFNQFIEDNKDQLMEVANQESISKRPLFQLASEESS